jgi:signal transduction histidine kinase
MNRLSVRLGLVFCVAVLIAVLLPFLFGFIIWRSGWFSSPIVPLPAIDSLEEIGAQDLMRIAGVAMLPIISSAIGITLALWFSRSLTRPLAELVDAAQTLGARNLGLRVKPQGTEELIALAHAFNQMAADLEQAETLRRKMVADIAHELRHPLTLLQGNLRAIIDDVYPLEKSEIAKLYDQTRHLNQLVNDLYELTQAEARQLPLQQREVELVPLLESVLAIFEPAAAGKGITLERQLPARLVAVADPDRLLQVLHNLLSNALRHTPAGGTISLRAEEAAGEIRLSVQDSGEGIAPEHLPRIFDRFYRTDRTRARHTGGAGLGLAIAKAIVESHGGVLSVASDGIGHGATFTFTLPTPAAN